MDRYCVQYLAFWPIIKHGIQSFNHVGATLLQQAVKVDAGDGHFGVPIRASVRPECTAGYAAAWGIMVRIES